MYITILVICFRVVFRGIYHKPLVFSGIKPSMYTKKIQVMSGIFHGYTTGNGCITIFIPCHRKYSGQMGRLGVIQLNCTD